MSRLRRARDWSHSVARVLARLIAVAFFGMRVTGREQLPATGRGLVCSNHQSYLDPVIVGLACDRRLNYLARETLFRSPGFRHLIQWYDAIPIRREGLGIGGLKETLRRLKHGELVLIFPEGTRTTDGNLQPLQPGFCAVARRAKAPLIPIGIRGAYEVWPRHRLLPRRRTIRVRWGEPIFPDQIATLSDEALIEQLSRRIRDCLD